MITVTVCPQKQGRKKKGQLFVTNAQKISLVAPTLLALLPRLHSGVQRLLCCHDSLYASVAATLLVFSFLRPPLVPVNVSNDAGHT